MAFVPAQNTLQVEVLQAMHGLALENVLYFQHGAGTIDQGAVDILFNVLQGWWANKVANVLSSSIALTGFFGTDLTTQTSPTYEEAVSATGGQIGAAQPSSVAFSLAFLTAGRGRSARGRNYVAGLREVDVGGNTLAGAVATGLRDGYNDLIVDAGIAGWNWVVLSRISGGVPRPNALLQPVTGVKYVNLQVDSQRRRVKQL